MPVPLPQTPEERARALSMLENQRDPGILRKMVMGLTEAPHTAWTTGQTPPTAQNMAMALSLMGGGMGGGMAGRALGAEMGDVGMALPVGHKVPPTYKITGEPAYPTIAHELPSGVQAYYDISRHPKTGTLDAELMFSGRQVGTHIGDPAPTAAIGRERLKDVFASVTDFVNRVKPSSLYYEAGSDKLRRLYDRITPQIAEQLGGHVQPTRGGKYRIAFFDAKRYSQPGTSWLPPDEPYNPPPVAASTVSRMYRDPDIPEGQSLSSHMIQFANEHGFDVGKVLQATAQIRRENPTATVRQVKQGFLMSRANAEGGQ